VSARSSVTWLALLVTLLTTLGLLGCAPEPGIALVSDPATLRFTPEHTRASVAIHNPGPLARPISNIRIGGPDWDALRFVDEDLPRSLIGHDVAILTLEVSPSAFLDGDRDHWRAGHATLEFESEGDHHEIAIEFAPEARPRASILQALLITLGLSLAAAALARARGPLVVPRSQVAVLGLALVLGGLVASAALLPIGPAWCSARLGEAVGTLELGQCRAGLGGHDLIGWAAGPSLAWLLVSLSAATFGLVLLGSPAERDRPARLVARLLGFGLILAALVASLGQGELGGLVAAQRQTIELGTLGLPRLGALVQPLAFVLALLLVADADLRAPEPTRLGTILARLDDLVWSALIVVLFLGAGSIPGLDDRPIPRLLHGPEITLALVAFVAKLALVMVLVRGLRGRPGHATPIDRRSRTVATLAIVNLLLTVSWLALARFFSG